MTNEQGQMSASLPGERGAVSAHVMRMPRGVRPGPRPEVANDVLVDEDVQLAQWGHAITLRTPA